MDVLSLTILFFIFEMIELRRSVGNNFCDIVYSYVIRYEKNAILFLLSQLNFIYIIFCIIILEKRSAVLYLLLFVYAMDLYLKVFIIDKIINNKSSSSLEVLLKENAYVSSNLKMAISIVTTILFYIGIS